MVLRGRLRVYSDFHLYQANKRNAAVDADKIAYPAADDTRIFQFIDDVRSNAINNALMPFRDFSDIEGYLRQQWAGMMFSFLLHQNEVARVTDTLSMLTSISERVEMLSRQILASVGTKTAKLTAELYDKMLQYECSRNMAYMGVRPTPKAVLSYESFDRCFEALGGALKIDPKEDYLSVGPDGYISLKKLEADRKNYRELREDLQQTLNSSGIGPEAYLAAGAA
jgi:hypothetical protein